MSKDDWMAGQLMNPATKAGTIFDTPDPAKRWDAIETALREAEARGRQSIIDQLQEPSEAMVEAMRHANLHEVDAPLYQRICRAIAAILAAPEETGDG